jgi:hypothetical protein
MIIAAFACCVAGVLLGTRFRVAILLPATLLTVAVIFSFGVLSGQKISLMIGWQIMAATALQVGYILAVIVTARPTRWLYQPHGITVNNSR